MRIPLGRPGRGVEDLPIEAQRVVKANRRWPRKAAFGLGTALVVLGLLEGLLQLASLVSGQDWRIDPLPQHEPYKVLCAHGPLLKLCPDKGEEYERVRPEAFNPKPNRPRIVAIGESFVYGLGLPMHEAWPARLAHRLNERAEVLNFGRCGTHTGLLHGILDGALVTQPDIVVLAIGNNEHTMTTFYSGPAGRMPLSTYRVLEVLSQFQIPGLINLVVGRPLSLVEDFDVKERYFDDPVDQRIYAIRRRPPDLSWFKDRLASYPVTRALEQEQRLKERIFRAHMESMVTRAKDQGVKVVLCTLPIMLRKKPELSGCQVPDEDACNRLRRIVRHLTEDDPPDRAAVVKRAFSIDPGVALLHYEAGMLAMERGDRRSAAAAFRQASEWDLLPDNTPTLNGIIRELAEDHRVPLVDLDALSDRHLDEPRKVFIDRVHMNAKGCDEVANDVAKVVKRALPAEL